MYSRTVRAALSCACVPGRLGIQDDLPGEERMIENQLIVPFSRLLRRSRKRAAKQRPEPLSRCSGIAQRYDPNPMDDEKALTAAIVELAGQFGRYGYRRITALLRHRGWHVNHKRVERICRREGLKVPARQPKRGRLWLNDGTGVRLLTVMDEYSRECLVLRAADVIEVLSELLVFRGVPDHIRSDNGPEFTARAVRESGLGGWESGRSTSRVSTGS